MNTTSISKGVFVFKNGAKAAGKKSRGKKKKREDLESDNIFSNCLWYKSYSSLWNQIETDIEDLNKAMFSSVLANLIKYIQSCYDKTVSEIPSAALLTGINMPDHAAQFKSLAKQIKSEITPNVACLYAEDCQNLKYLIEHMIMQFMKEEEDSDISEDEDSDRETKKSNVKKSQCNFALLQAWYEKQKIENIKNKSPSKGAAIKDNSLVVIIPDFESFNDVVLQEFILIASSYLNILPFVLIFGVATSLTVLHKSLPYQVSSKVNIQVFNSQPSTMYLNKVLEKIFFTPNSPFHLGGRVFTLFTDIFLFYDLSVTGFIQNYKYAMLDHFSQGKAMALCTSKENIKNILNEFTHEDFEQVRHFMSFRRLVESQTLPETRIKLITDYDYFKNVLEEELLKVYEYLEKFHTFLKCLHVLVHDLPKAPLGKQVRELYAIASSKNITTTQEYKECLQLLSFQSKDELTDKVIKICEIIVPAAENKNNELFEQSVETVTDLLEKLTTFDFNDDSEEITEMSTESPSINTGKMDRQKLKETLLQMSKQNKTMNKYEKLRASTLNLLDDMFKNNLKEPTTLNFHEIFFFNDVSVQTQIVGAHRAAIHTALNDPHYYLQCPCCEIPNDSVILRNMPDISIIYKLHLEYGKMINLYDWIQAFLSIVDPVMEDDDDHPKEVDPELQARFTQAVAELEFLGFIKSSKRKTDHVARLTWGG